MDKAIEKLKNVPFVKKHWRIVKFIGVGGINTVLDFLIYGLLANIVGMPQVLANIISTTICIAISFYLNNKYVWKSKKSRRETIPGFLIVSFFSAWIMQNLGIGICLAILGQGAVRNLIAKVAGSCFGIVSNYFGYKIVFTKDFMSALRKIKKRFGRK